MGPYILRFTPVNADRYAYWHALMQCWRAPDVFVNVEWDMEFSGQLVENLLACSYPLCTHAYQMHLPRTYWAHGQLPPEPSLREAASCIQWISEGEQFAEYSGLGFCKIAPSARLADIERTEWPGVEQMTNRAVQGPWHVHWPAIQHYHTKDGQRTC